MEVWPRADQVESSNLGDGRGQYHSSSQSDSTSASAGVKFHDNSQNLHSAVESIMAQRNTSTNTRLRKNSSYLPPPNGPEYLPNVANSVFSSQSRSRHGSNVTIVGAGPHLTSNSASQSKNPSITTVIDDTIT